MKHHFSLSSTLRITLLIATAFVLGIPQITRAKDEFSWLGRIEARPTTGSVGTWTLRGRSFVATSATVINEEAGSLSLQACAELKYVSEGGVDTATRIERQPDSICGGGEDPGGEQNTYGLIESIPAGNIGVWQIGGKSYNVTASTTLRQEHGPLAVGVCAEVEFTSAGGSNTARSIGSEDAYRCSNGSFVNHAFGSIDAFPANLVGTWTIGGVAYEATASTSFSQSRPFAIGGCAKVAYYTQNGVNVAQEIESEDDCAGRPSSHPEALRKLYAPIESLPANPFVGAWRIGGVDFVATTTTRFEQNTGAFAAGVCVEAKYTVANGTNQLVAVESKPAARCQFGGVATVRAYGSIDSFPTTLVGAWSIGGISYTTNVSTTFEQRFGAFAVGAFVEVSYRIDGSNRIATRIETHVAPGEGRVSGIGTLDSRPSDDTGTWVIGGTSYRGDDAIEIELEHERSTLQSTAAAAPLVIVNGYQASDGTLYATSVTTVRQVFLPTVRK